jgi:hypothetical protein
MGKARSITMKSPLSTVAGSTALVIRHVPVAMAGVLFVLMNDGLA